MSKDYFNGWMDGVTSVMNFLNTLETSEISKKELYRELMKMRPHV